MPRYQNPMPRYTTQDAPIADLLDGLGYSASQILSAMLDYEGDDTFILSIQAQYTERGDLSFAQWRSVIRSLGATLDEIPLDAAAPAPAPAPAPVAAKSAPVKNKRRRLPNADRAYIRTRITKHADWSDYSNRVGVNSGQLSADKLWDCLDALGMLADDLLADRNADIKRGNTSFAAIGSSTDASATPRVAGVSREEARRIAKEEVDRAINPLPRVVTVSVRKGAKASPAVDGAALPEHPEFNKLARLVDVTDFQGARLQPFLVGPTGTGKSFACKQLATLREQEFRFQSVAIEAYDLIGYERVNGSLKVTQFVEAFRDGHVFLADEIDRWNPSAVVALNAALANGRLALDDGSIIARHPDFIFIGAGNTYGFGADDNFHAAQPMDFSTLSRLAVRLDWRVVDEVEDAIARAFADNADLAAAWVNEVRAVRVALAAADLPPLADQRCIEAGANLLANGFSPDDVRAMTYLAPLTTEQRDAVRTRTNHVTHLLKGN